MTPSDLARMTDHEIATHASGGYGPAKRNEFSRCLREMLPKASAVAASTMDQSSYASGFSPQTLLSKDPLYRPMEDPDWLAKNWKSPEGPSVA